MQHATHNITRHATLSLRLFCVSLGSVTCTHTRNILPILFFFGFFLCTSFVWCRFFRLLVQHGRHVCATHDIHYTMCKSHRLFSARCFAMDRMTLCCLCCARSRTQRGTNIFSLCIYSSEAIKNY